MLENVPLLSLRHCLVLMNSGDLQRLTAYSSLPSSPWGILSFRCLPIPDTVGDSDMLDSVLAGLPTVHPYAVPTKHVPLLAIMRSLDDLLYLIMVIPRQKQPNIFPMSFRHHCRTQLPKQQNLRTNHSCLYKVPF